MTAGVVFCPVDHNFYISSNKRVPHLGRPMKRRIQQEEEMEPQRKRPIYEERMSNKLCNFHINDNEGNGNGTNRPCTSNSVEELEDWRIDDYELTDVLEPIIEECTFGENNINDQSSIVLSDQLKSYIESCKNVDDLSFLKSKKMGNELILYRPCNLKNNTQGDNDDIRNRIFEIENWIDEDKEINNSDGLNTQTAQVVSFPDDSSVSSYNLGSASSSSSIVSMSSITEQPNNVFLDGAESLNMETENEMDID